MVAMVRLMEVPVSESAAMVIPTSTSPWDSLTQYSCIKNCMVTFVTA